MSNCTARMYRGWVIRQQQTDVTTDYQNNNDVKALRDQMNGFDF